MEPHCDIHLPIGETLAVSGSSFSLEKAVCSHGLFMMAPNRWDPVSSSLTRPLRLSPSDEPRSLLVRVSQPSDRSLLVRVIGVPALSDSQRSAVTAQVRRMLRLSESDERKVSEFQRMHAGAKAAGFGRVFRSPTLFEDMVKCILLCNCQWPRTLSMAKALCQLQSELQNHPSVPPPADTTIATSRSEHHLCPNTPAGKESTKKRIRKPTKIPKLLFTKEPSVVAELETGGAANSHVNNCIPLLEKSTPTSILLDTEDVMYEGGNCCQLSDGNCEPDSEGRKQNSQSVGNFPSPNEIASLDEKYLTKHCNLGYRAGRILKLAQSIVEGKVQLSELEDICNDTNSTSYFELDQKLKEINGFGPFTRGNVLMCMGYYNVIPTDSETIRHLKQVHRISANPQTVQEMVEKIYGSFEPFQFLAYWLEVWTFYEDWFGKFSKMPSSEYGLVTASKMRVKRKHGVETYIP